MKKLLAVLLAVVMVFGTTVIAFADDTADTTKATTVKVGDAEDEVKESSKVADNADGKYNVCVCGAAFATEAEYSKHIAVCPVYQKDTNYLYGVNLMSVVDKIVDVFETNIDWMNAVEGLIVRIIDLIENIGTSLVSEADVAGAVADLEAKIGDLGIVGDVLDYVEGLINTLKQKIKDLYAGNKETEAPVTEEEVVETTEAEEVVDTGSSFAGIAAFAAISVAAAAAFVCTKKKED